MGHECQKEDKPVHLAKVGVTNHLAVTLVLHNRLSLLKPERTSIKRICLVRVYTIIQNHVPEAIERTIYKTFKTDLPKETSERCPKEILNGPFERDPVGTH